MDMDPRRAKLFKHGGSQAVRLPHEFRFEGTEVSVRRDPITGDVVLSTQAGTWSNFFALRAELGGAPDFLVERDDQPPQKRRSIGG